MSHLAGAVAEREKKKGQLHKVFTDSFDAKGIYNQKFFNQKLQYIHRNPVSGKWNLVKDYTEYEHSSASFYETGLAGGYEPFDYRLSQRLIHRGWLGPNPVRQSLIVIKGDPERTKN